MPINLSKVETEAPALVSLAKQAAVALEQRGLGDASAAVYLVLDHSRSMQPHYRSGAVQRLAEQALALCAHLDDDGVVPVVFFGSEAAPAVDVRLSEYEGVIEHLHVRQPWGTTNLPAAMRAVVAHYRASGSADPALVITQTDGNPNSRRDAAHTMRDVSGLPLFWSFVGFGDRIEFLEKLDSLRGRRVDNASLVHAADPHAMGDAELYDGLLHEYPAWLEAARAAGVLPA
ncbi:VWA domain-containing protein [Streptomyces sp. NBRC 109706]|uniref:VWA domain-containing protein n=1 Tax=Streptomyces sp. NBRC 109706 TaxID=1550035 RepID=UPI0007852737|nr:VWA domain-containing protein [Streptomyces sp. NBRC 109706]